MSALDEHLKKHRKQIIAREEKTFRELLSHYSEIETELKKTFADLQKKILAAKANGETISMSWFYREKRLKSLLSQVQEQITKFGGKASKIIEREQRAAIEIALTQAEETFKFQVQDSKLESSDYIVQMNPRAVETAVGVIGDGSPLLSYFEKNLAPAVAAKLKTEIIKAVAIGTSFSTIAKRLQETGDITRSRALATARTEVNRVRREATRQRYLDNADRFEGWEWVASHSTRTCPLCLVQDGEIFPLSEPFPQHINCRCRMIGVLKSIKLPPRKTGKEYFADLSDSDKAKIVGKDALAAMKTGDITLNDFVAFRDDKRFGKSVTRKPLAQILSEKGNVRESNQVKILKFEKKNEAKKAATSLIAEAAKNEPQITKSLQLLSKANNSEMVGLENRFKTEKSLQRKISDTSLRTGETAKQSAQAIDDALRYTMVFDEKDYGSGSNAILTELKSKGFKVENIWNAWDMEGTGADTGYRGINVSLISSKKQRFELQFHTGESYSLKTVTHDLYEERRNPKVTKKRFKELLEIGVKNSKSIKHPKGI